MKKVFVITAVLTATMFVQSCGSGNQQTIDSTTVEDSTLVQPELVEEPIEDSIKRDTVVVM